ncbi:VWA domain-containing protein [Haliea sp. AH-315-K21]|uniref:BatB protein n=1 Tax=SAR86 cluster bacterium TaxID=2030880 RepID=A0A2A5CF36_9GAMM|nr:VWA domain-containing protein [Haliea sp. AH-315-K21]MBN4075177.1 VWA domain-containing protein [Gammaproteobacteria bacterium AH-315-E17]PCJ42128.1 MAG: BatB protein [SAR86 cluster bacterium]
MIEFQWPWIFILLPLPYFINRLMPRAEIIEAPLFVPFFTSLKSAVNFSPRLGSRSLLLSLLALLCWLLLVAAASRPQWVGEPVQLPTTGRDLMLSVDISGSMEAQDIQLEGRNATRLEVVKSVVGDFVERRSGDRLGLILFAARAYTQAPLTFDRETVGILLEEAQIGIIEENATAIGDAIGLGVRHLRERPEASRILILLTDGVNNAGQVSPLQAGELASREGIRIYTIGIGAESSARSSIFSSRAVNPSADLDETTLTEIAENTGGQYFRARNIEELEQIYAILDELEPVEQEDETFRPTIALFYWPLGLCLFLSFLIALTRLPILSPWKKVLAEPIAMTESKN